VVYGIPPRLFMFLAVEGVRPARFSMERFVIPKESSSEGLCSVPTWFSAVLGVNNACSDVVDGCGVLGLIG